MTFLSSGGTQHQCTYGLDNDCSDYLPASTLAYLNRVFFPPNLVCNHNCVVQFVGVLFRPTPSVVTMFMENGSVEDMLVSGDGSAKKELVVRMAIEAAKGVIHLHRLV